MWRLALIILISISLSAMDNSNKINITPKFNEIRALIEMKKCKECGKLCKNNAGLSCHIRRHKRENEEKLGIYSPDKVHPCDRCNEKFTNKSALVSHKKIHETTKTDQRTHPLLCMQCYKIFYNKTRLENHIKKNNCQD